MIKWKKNIDTFRTEKHLSYLSYSISSKSNLQVVLVYFVRMNKKKISTSLQIRKCDVHRNIEWYRIQSKCSNPQFQWKSKNFEKPAFNNINFNQNKRIKGIVFYYYSISLAHHDEILAQRHMYNINHPIEPLHAFDLFFLFCFAEFCSKSFRWPYQGAKIHA